MRRMFIAMLALASALSFAGAADVTFTAKPTAMKAGNGAKIAFAVSAATDVEVAVLDKDGKVVRHLVAGQLGGKNPPPAPLKPGLVQDITWDGNDDAGKPAAGGPFRVRVNLGLSPAFDKMIGENPGDLGGVRAFAVGPKGELYVVHNYGAIHPDDDTAFCTVFGRDGKYLRTILPFSGALPAEKTKPLKRLQFPDGTSAPYLYCGESRSVVPGTGGLALHQAAVGPDGRLAFLGLQEFIGTQSRYNQGGDLQVTVVNADGSMAPEGCLGPVLARGTQHGGSLAASPDGKTLYATDLVDGRSTKAKRRHCLYQFGWLDKEPRVLFGSPEQGGAGQDKLDTPTSVAAGGDGTLYVADRGNDRIVVLSPDGKFLGELKCDDPDRIGVHPKTGALYVLAGEKDRVLRKYANWKSPQPVAEMKVPYWTKTEGDITSLAVDGTADPTIIYYSAARLGYVAGASILRIEEKGNAFAAGVDFEKFAGVKGGGVDSMLFMTLDADRNRLYVGEKLYDTKTGTLANGFGGIIKNRDRISMIGTKAGMGSIGLDGNIYLMGYPKWLRRYGPDLKEVPFTGPNSKAGAVENDEGSLRLRARGVTADRQGNIYALWQADEKGPIGTANYLTVHAPDGAVKQKKLIDSQIRHIESIAVDNQGNLYLAAGLRPKGMTLPEAFKGMDLGPRWKYGINIHQMNWYEMLYGVVMKFPATGGKIVLTKSADAASVWEYGQPGRNMFVTVDGAQWIYFGMSPAPTWRQPYPDTCDCESARFTVDGFGRVFFPDAARFRVGALDTNGNELGYFGSYGNADDAGRKAAGADAAPAIPLYWPYMLAADNDATLYIGDRLNRRVVAVRLDHAASETCDVR